MGIMTKKEREFWKGYGEGQKDPEHGFEAGKREGYAQAIQDALKALNDYDWSNSDCNSECKIRISKQLKSLSRRGK